MHRPSEDTTEYAQTSRGHHWVCTGLHAEDTTEYAQTSRGHCWVSTDLQKTPLQTSRGHRCVCTALQRTSLRMHKSPVHITGYVHRLHLWGCRARIPLIMGRSVCLSIYKRLHARAGTSRLHARKMSAECDNVSELEDIDAEVRPDIWCYWDNIYFYWHALGQDWLVMKLECHCPRYV